MSSCCVFDSLLSQGPASSPSPLSSVSTLLLRDPSVFSWSISILSWMAPPPAALCSALTWRRRVGDSLPRYLLLSSGPDSILSRMVLTKWMLLHSLRFGWTVLATEQTLIFWPLLLPPSAAVIPAAAGRLTTCRCSLLSSPSIDDGIQPHGMLSCFSVCSLAQPCQLWAKLATIAVHLIFRTARLKVCGSCDDTVLIPALLMAKCGSCCFLVLCFFNPSSSESSLWVALFSIKVTQCLNWRRKKLFS